jgi:hypothetical protein
MLEHRSLKNNTNRRYFGAPRITEQKMRERPFPANLQAEQRRIGQEAVESYKINGAAVIFCLIALWWDAGRTGAAAVLAMMALYNFGALWFNKVRLNRAHDRDTQRPLPATPLQSDA